MVYKNKTKGNSPKDFSGYQNLMDLFINLRDGNVNPRGVLKNKIDFKSDLVLYKMFNFFKFFIMISEAEYKAKYGEGLKILSPNQMLQRSQIALA